MDVTQQKSQLQHKENGSTQSLKHESEGQRVHELIHRKRQVIKFASEYWLNSHLHHRTMVWRYLIHQFLVFFFNYFMNHFFWRHFTPMLCQLLREIRVESLEKTLILRFPMFLCHSEIRNTLRVFCGLRHLVFSFLGWGIYANSYTITENFEASKMSFHHRTVDGNLVFSFSGFPFPV